MRNKNSVLTFAIILIVIWLVASVTKFIAGALLNVILLAAVVLLIVWALRKFRR